MPAKYECGIYYMYSNLMRIFLSVHKILEKSEFNIYLKNLGFQAEQAEPLVFQPDAYALHA